MGDDDEWNKMRRRNLKQGPPESSPNARVAEVKSMMTRSDISVALILLAIVLVSTLWVIQVRNYWERAEQIQTPVHTPAWIWEPNQFKPLLDAITKVKGETLQAPRKLVLTIYSTISGPAFNKERIMANRQRYSGLYASHPYLDVRPYFQLTPTEKFPSWQKIADYEQLAKGSDYIWYLDADAFIMSQKNVFGVILRQGKHCDVIFTTDPNGINGGSFIVRTSPWSTAFMKRVYSLRNDETIPKVQTWWEQAVFQYLLNETAGHVCLTDQQELNAYPDVEWYREFMSENLPYFWQEGDLVIHGPGLGYRALEKYLDENNLRET